MYQERNPTRKQSTSQQDLGYQQRSPTSRTQCVPSNQIRWLAVGKDVSECQERSWISGEEAGNDTRKLMQYQIRQQSLASECTFHIRSALGHKRKSPITERGWDVLSKSDIRKEDQCRKQAPASGKSESVNKEIRCQKRNPTLSNKKSDVGWKSHQLSAKKCNIRKLTTAVAKRSQISKKTFTSGKTF